MEKYRSASVIIPIENDKRDFDIHIGYKYDLLFQRRGFVVPGFDNHGIQGNRLIIFPGGIGF